jgi:hypothetical protein
MSIMRTAMLALAAILALTGWGCGATTRGAGITADPTLATASVTFMTRDDGKDDDSAIAVQIMDDSGRLSAEGTVVDTEFDGQTVSRPLALTMTRTVYASDLDEARVRLRFTPDGRDSWTFDMRMTLGLSDGTQRSYFWQGLRMDETAPERSVTLLSGRLP